MVEYADRECHDCLGLFPANQLKRKSLSKQTGSSVRGVDLRDEGDLLNPARTRTYYQNVEIFLCRDCRSRRRYDVIKKFFGCLTALVIAGVLGFAGIVWLGSRSSTSNANQQPNVDAEINYPAVPSEVGQPTQLEVYDENLDLTRGIGDVEDVESLEESESEPSSADNTPLPALIDQPTVPLDRLGNFTEEAMNTGSAVRWSFEGMSGYVVPSDANEVGCRDYYFTDDSRPEWRSATQSYCPAE
ncbi:MAG: hypothetical protein ABJP48_03580 [Erythrobacter sp.]